MDPVSHIVFGFALHYGRMGPKSNSGSPIGTSLAITLGTLAPDVDSLLMPAGWDRYLLAHEIGTHSALGAVLCGFGAAGVTRLIRRRAEYRRLLIPAVVSSMSHVLADLLSGASIRLGWPVLAAKVSNIGVVAMADPFVVAAGAVAGAAMIFLPARRTQMAIVVLCGFALFTLEKTLLRERAELTYREHPDRGTVTASYLVEPVWGSVMRWRIFDRTATVARAWSVDVTGETTVEFSVPLANGDAHLVAGSLDWDTVRNFRRAHDFAFAVATREAVEWSDVRYCSPRAPNLVPQCGVWAGGEFETAPELRRLVVRVGDWVQTR